MRTPPMLSSSMATTRYRSSRSLSPFPNTNCFREDCKTRSCMRRISSEKIWQVRVCLANHLNKKLNLSVTPTGVHNTKSYCHYTPYKWHVPAQYGFFGTPISRWRQNHAVLVARLLRDGVITCSLNHREGYTMTDPDADVGDEVSDYKDSHRANTISQQEEEVDSNSGNSGNDDDEDTETITSDEGGRDERPITRQYGKKLKARGQHQILPNNFKTPTKHQRQVRKEAPFSVRISTEGNRGRRAGSEARPAVKEKRLILVGKDVREVRINISVDERNAEMLREWLEESGKGILTNF